MSILAAIPGGSCLSVVDRNPAADIEGSEEYVRSLIEKLTGPQREVWDTDKRFKLLFDLLGCQLIIHVISFKRFLKRPGAHAPR